MASPTRATAAASIGSASAMAWWIASGDDAQPGCRCRWRRETTAPDHEGIVALLPDGSFAVVGRGYGPRAAVCRRRSTSTAGTATSSVGFRVPDKFVPEPTGPATRGARGNAGFESLTLTPDGERLFTAAETALIQDGDRGDVRGRRADAHPRVRGRARSTFEPAREFVYDLEPVRQAAVHAPGFYINGLVELLALNRTTLLALERGYVENKANAAAEPQSHPVYTDLSLTGATDVSRARIAQGASGDRPGDQDAAARSVRTSRDSARSSRPASTISRA